MPADSDIAVTGIGLVTPAGLGAKATWGGLCEGRSAARPDPCLYGMEVDFSCAVPQLPVDAGVDPRLADRLDSHALMALLAAEEAVADAGLDPASWDGTRTAVVLGVGGNSLSTYAEEFGHLNAGHPERISRWTLPRSLPNMVAGEICQRFGAQGPSFTVSSACASGATAAGVARDLLRAGSCDIAITGGSSSARTAMACACFSRLGVLSRRRGAPGSASRPFDADRDGFVLGEGAAVLVLERTDDASRRGVRPRALLAGYGASCDAFHRTSPDPRSRGAELAVRRALDDARCTPADIGQVNAHGAATLRGDAAEAGLLARVFPHRPAVTASKGVIGHSLAAAAAIDSALTVLSLHHGMVPPIANLEAPGSDTAGPAYVAGEPRRVGSRYAMSNAFGFGGHNAVLVFKSV